MFLTVYLSNNDQHFTEVPVTPETLCRDVVDLCKEPGEADCHLSEMWRGSGEWRRQFIQRYPHPSTHNDEQFAVLVVEYWMYPKGQESLCRHLFVFFLLIRGKLLFWSTPYMEISCVVNCLEISFWRAYLFWGCNANEAEPIIPVTNTSSQTSPASLRWEEGGVEISCLPPIFPHLWESGGIQNQNSRSQASSLFPWWCCRKSEASANYCVWVLPQVVWKDCLILQPFLSTGWLSLKTQQWHFASNFRCKAINNLNITGVTDLFCSHAITIDHFHDLYLTVMCQSICVMKWSEAGWRKCLRNGWWALWLATSQNNWQHITVVFPEVITQKDQLDADGAGEMNSFQFRPAVSGECLDGILQSKPAHLTYIGVVMCFNLAKLYTIKCLMLLLRVC